MKWYKYKSFSFKFENKKFNYEFHYFEEFGTGLFYSANKPMWRTSILVPAYFILILNMRKKIFLYTLLK